MAIAIYGLDSLIIDVPVTVAGSQNAFNLTGASVDAACDGPGSPIGATTTEIVDAAGGLIRVSFARGTFRGKSGSYVLQVRALKDGQRQTVAQANFTVIESIYVAGQES